MTSPLHWGAAAAFALAPLCAVSCATQPRSEETALATRHASRRLAVETPKIAPTPAPTTAPSEGDDAWVGEYIQYTVNPELGEIVIADHLLRGKGPVVYLQDHSAELAKKGMYGCVDETQRRFFANDNVVDGHRVQSLVVIDPPTDSNPNFTAHLLTAIDAKPKINCTIGVSASGDLIVNRVTIYPADGTIDSVVNSGDGEQLSIPDDYATIGNSLIITDDAFSDDADPGPGDAPERQVAAGPHRATQPLAKHRRAIHRQSTTRPVHSRP